MLEMKFSLFNVMLWFKESANSFRLGDLPVFQLKCLFEVTNF